ncbi:MAG: nucleotidyltransferase family protein [Ruminococcus sp.]|nr:nucleotidyltransferase family protein [Ruminococcus sp.]
MDKCAGIVCEFDPFHNGHSYLLDKVRSMGYTHIVCAMSGDLTQRGDVAIADKQARAECAVKNGADLVIELPPPFCCSCAEVFAKSAVKLLKAAGAQVIAFGTEYDDKALLSECADISEKIKDDSDIAAIVADGFSYPRAVSTVVSSKYGREYAIILSEPNATLGIEYIKAARLYGLDDFVPIKRKGVSHDSDELLNGYTSASNIRRLIRKGIDVSTLTLLDMNEQTPAFIDRMEGHILYTLCMADEQTLRKCPDVNTQILESILNMRKNAPADLGEMYILLKCRGVTLARLRRVALFISSGLENADVDELTAARVLAFNERGAKLLSQAKGGDILFDTSLARIGEAVPKIVQNIIKGSYFRYLCTDRSNDPINEYTRKISIERDMADS